MKKKRIRIGTRSSELALWQADFVAQKLRARYPELEVEEIRIKTKGDKILDAPLAKIGGKGLFTKELEQAMLDGSIDLAVHSLKDVPTELPDGLTLGAITKRSYAGDVLVSERYGSFAELPQGAKVGTSSLRRKAQLLHERPDLQIVSLRGNVNSRLRKMHDEGFDAIVLAEAGMQRLDKGAQITEKLPMRWILPAVGQGALAVETRAKDEEMLDLLAFLNDADMAAAARAERAFLARVEGGCQVPVGVYGTAEGDALRIEAVIASLDGARLYRAAAEGSREDAESLGTDLADKLLDAGGIAILHELGLLLDRN